MDFGALQCTPVSPGCGSCPLAEGCEALRTGRVALLPVKKRPVAVKTRRLTYVHVRCDGRTAIRRRGPGDIWQGLWEPLAYEDAPDGFLQAAFPEARITLLRKAVRHVLTHRILLCDFYLMETQTPPALPDGYVWVAEKDLDGYGKPRLFELLLEAAGTSGN